MSIFTTRPPVMITGNNAILVLASLRDRHILDQPTWTWIVRRLYSSPRGSCHLRLRYSDGQVNQVHIIYTNQILPLERDWLNSHLMTPSSVVQEQQFVRYGLMEDTRRCSPVVSTKQQER